MIVSSSVRAIGSKANKAARKSWSINEPYASDRYAAEESNDSSTAHASHPSLPLNAVQ
jgi:hypothetical protein